MPYFLTIVRFRILHFFNILFNFFFLSFIFIIFLERIIFAHSFCFQILSYNSKIYRLMRTLSNVKSVELLVMGHLCDIMSHLRKDCQIYWIILISHFDGIFCTCQIGPTLPQENPQNMRQRKQPKKRVTIS